MRKFGVFALALGLMVGACGSDDEGGSALADALASAENLEGQDKEAFDALSNQFNEDGPTSGITAEQEACVGLGMLNALGAERLLEATAEDDLVLDEGDATKAADAFLGCVDMRDIFAQEFAGDGEISEKSAQCMVADLDNDAIRPFLIQSFQGQDSDADVPPELLQSMLANMATCLTPEELAKVTS